MISANYQFFTPISVFAYLDHIDPFILRMFIPYIQIRKRNSIFLSGFGGEIKFRIAAVIVNYTIVFSFFASSFTFIAI